MKVKILAFILCLISVIGWALFSNAEKPLIRPFDVKLNDLDDVTLTDIATGNIFYYNGVAWVNLAKGSNGEFLILAAGIPAWDALIDSEDVVLAPSAERDTSGNNHTNSVDTSSHTEGFFVLEVDQAGTWIDETLDVSIEVYEDLTDDWYVLASFTQVTDADSGTGTQQEMIRIPYGLGSINSCKWTIANMNTGKEYTFSVSGTIK